jgi:TatD DNase family protein
LLELVDTHTHLDEIDNLDDALANARKAGVEAIVAVGTHEESNRKTMDIAEKYPSFVYPAFGLHPWEMGDMQPDRVESTIRLIEENIERIVAIGEVGLDYDKRVVSRTSKELQKEVLHRLLTLSAKYNKPVSLHSRYSWKDCFDMVESTGAKKVVFHWFTGFSSVLKEIISAGYYISCTPAAEYHEEHRRAIKEVPVEKLMLETDSPVTYGRELKFKAYPADVVRSLKAAAALKGIDEENLGQQTTDNAFRFFSIKTA